jgi:hypothetical protein
MGVLFWLSDEQSAAITPHLPRNQPGARRVQGDPQHAAVDQFHPHRVLVKSNADRLHKVRQSIHSVPSGKLRRACTTFTTSMRVSVTR